MTRIASFATLLAFVTVCLAATPTVKRDVPAVEADLSAIAAQVTSLDNQINAFPNTGGSLAAALAIHNAATTLASALGHAATDVASTPAVSETDGQAILGQVQGFEPTIIDALKEIVAKKPAFDALPLGGVSALVKQDLATLQSDTKQFENNLIAKTPADLTSPAASLTSAIDSALATAAAAYASA